MKKQQYFFLVTIIVSTVLLGAGCSGSVPTNQSGATIPPTINTPLTQSSSQNASSTEKATLVSASNVGVKIVSFSFQPSSISVTAGGIVTWTNNDGMPHTVTADDGSFDSGPIAPGATFSHTFSAVGTVAYHCSFHGSMHGSVSITP